MFWKERGTIMVFVDFNGNGSIDPSDIAIGLAIDEEERNKERKEDDKD